MAAGEFSASRRTSLLPLDYHPSYILYLKKKEHILYEDFIESELQVGGLAHPALVIRKETFKSSHVRICLLTTFGGVSVNDKYPCNTSIWDNYLPIHPNQPIIPGGVQLQLGDLELRKPSYVVMKDEYTVHTDMLERYDRRCAASRFYLDSKSFNIILERLILRPERRPAKARFDDIDIYTPTVWDQGRTTPLDTSLANSGESATYTSTRWDEWDGGTTVAGRDESAIHISTMRDEWYGGVTVAEIMPNQPTTIRSLPGAYATLELSGRQQAHSRSERTNNLTSAQRRQTTLHDLVRTPTLPQQPTVPHLDREEPKDSFLNVAETMVLVTGGLAIGGWLGLKASRAIGKLMS